MKAFNVILRNGHLIDQGTGTNLFLKEGAEFIALLNNENDLLAENRLLQRPEVLSAEEKRKKLEAKFGKENLIFLFPANTEFAFRVGLGKSQQGEKMEYLFKCRLLEDLYMHGTGSDPAAYGLCDSACETTECVEGGLVLSTPIPAKSLNQLYNKTVSHLFPLQRAASGNAFAEFFHLTGTNVKMADLKNKYLENLEVFRHKKVKTDK